MGLKEDREALFIRFGAQMMEAFALVIKDEINLLRTKAGLSERTYQQIINAIKNKLDGIDMYDWMKKY